MNAAPLAKMDLITMEVNLILAGLIGFGFGFMLERAGFGSAHRLVGQWYMRDWSVFKVMFTGVVTALFGVLILNGLGLMSFEALYLNKTLLGCSDHWWTGDGRRFCDWRILPRHFFCGACLR